ncbi:hypothetical protein M0208_10505 [Sphingomonas sp. SUN019]|uniref:hypothetical protein n=1 Tax=Sphingomonas sp. SUN019 TaxID=2937788 RepID=UPI00216478A5|nr:hypothetical protein [Sphingomonas sp. SUN019]UVO50925.1 hypothetical protein M0208_10505 [Sphingomonas sp. SUN019]
MRRPIGASNRIARPPRASPRFVTLPKGLGWTDGVHLTSAGYETVARALAPVVVDAAHRASNAEGRTP